MKVRDTTYKKLISIACIAFAVVLLSAIAITLNHCDSKRAEIISQTKIEEVKDIQPKHSVLDDYVMPTYPWQELGYTSIVDYHNDLLAMNEEAAGKADEAIELYSLVITDDQKERLLYLEDKMANTLTMTQYNEYLEEFNAITEECDAELAKITSVYSSGSSNGYSGGYTSSGSGLTKSGGVFYFNGHKETWYSQRVLPGGGLSIPGRYVAADGTIRDANGYICVASSDLPYGSTVETSLGTGKVYDTGCASGVVDIYTDW